MQLTLFQLILAAVVVVQLIRLKVRNSKYHNKLEVSSEDSVVDAYALQLINCDLCLAVWATVLVAVVGLIPAVGTTAIAITGVMGSVYLTVSALRTLESK